jgi:hypothetical protein
MRLLLRRSIERESRRSVMSDETTMYGDVHSEWVCLSANLMTS